jgi:flagellar motor switch protein FliM
VERILSEEEIEALLKAAQELKPSSAPPARLSPGEAVAYDLTSQGRPVRGPLPALDMVDHRFTRFMRATFSGSLRRRVEVAPGARAFLKLEEALAGMRSPSCLALFRLEPLQAFGMMLFDPGFVYAVLDAFFGAKSQSDDSAELRELTTIEQRILGRVSRVILEDLVKAWRPIAELRPELLRIELNPQFVTLLPAHAVVVDTKYSIDLDSRRTHLSTFLAYGALEPLKDRLSSGVHSHEQADDSLRTRVWEQLRSAPARISVELGRGRLRVGDLLKLQPGMVLPLEGNTDGGAVLRIEGGVKATGKPITAHGNYAVRLERMSPRKAT